MNPIVAAIVAYLTANNLNHITPAEVNRHALAIETAINGAAGHEDQAISQYVLAQHLVPDQATADRFGAQIWRDVQAARANHGNGNNNQTQTPPVHATPATHATPARNGNGWAMAAAFVALIAAILAGLGLMRDNGSSKLDKIEHAVYTDAGQGVAEVALATHEGIKVALPKLATKDDLVPIAKITDVQALGTKIDAVDTKVSHVERVVVGALTFTDKKPCKDGTPGKEHIISMRGVARTSDLAGLVHQGDLADLARTDDLSGFAKRGELEKAFSNQGTVVVETEGDARVLTGDDALRAPPPPAPVSATP